MNNAKYLMMKAAAVTMSAMMTASMAAPSYAIGFPESTHPELFEIASYEAQTNRLPDAVRGEPYSVPLTVEDNMSVEGLPEGLSFTDGVINGTPVVAGSFEVRLKDHTGETADQVLTLNVLEKAPEPVTAPKITTSFLPLGKTGADYFAQMQAEGTAPIQWSAVGLPAGLSIDPVSGQVKGIPEADGLYKADITAHNAAGSDTISITVEIMKPAPVEVYSIRASIDHGGMIKGPNPQNIEKGRASEELIFTPAKGYHIDKVLVNDQEQENVQGAERYVFRSVDSIQENYSIVVYTEADSIHNKGLGIDNMTVNTDNGTTNAGGRVGVGTVYSYDKLDCIPNQHTVSFAPNKGWKNAVTFGVTVKDQKGTVINRFTMMTPSANSSTLKTAVGSAGTQSEWNQMFPDASAEIYNGIVYLKLADKAERLPYQVDVETRFVPTLTAKASTVGGTASVSNLSVMAQSDKGYKVDKIAVTDPATGKVLSLTSLPANPNQYGEYFNRSTGEFAGLMQTRIADQDAKIWVKGRIRCTVQENQPITARVTFEGLPIALSTEVSFAKYADNKKPYADSTGNLTIKNVVAQGDPDKGFTFTLNLPDFANGEYEMDGDAAGWIRDGSQVVLYAGESVTIYGLPEGGRYSIEMKDSGNYDTSFDISNGREDKGRKTDKFQIENGKDTIVVFTSKNKAITPPADQGTDFVPEINMGGQKPNPNTGM